MIRLAFLAMLAVAIAASARGAASGTISEAQAKMFVGAKGDSVHTTLATWNGKPTVFVDFLDGPDDRASRQVWAVQKLNNHPRSMKVTVAEQNGGSGDVAAIAFANADRDAAKELIVILTWPVAHHSVVGGTFYEVQLFDDPRPGQMRLTPLTRLNRHFGSGCDCDWNNGRHKRFPFKTIRAVREELTKLGY